MPGTANLLQNLVDDLVPTVDSLRQDLHSDFGVRHFRLFTVFRTWTAVPGTPGATFTDVEAEILPRPKVEPFTGYGYQLKPCGLDESGRIKVSEVSLTYTEAELGGMALPGETTQRLWRVQEGMGQATTTRYFSLARPPFPDREDTIGWLLELVEAKVSAAGNDLARDPTWDSEGNPVYGRTGEAVWS